MYGIDDEFADPGTRPVTVTSYRRLAKEGRLRLWQKHAALKTRCVDIAPGPFGDTGVTERIAEAAFNELLALGVPETP
jgi:hypothetical protein